MTTTSENNWRDLADRLTAEQVAELEGLERNDISRAIKDWPLLLSVNAQYYVERNELAARYAAMPLPAGAVKVNHWDADDNVGARRYFEGKKWVVDADGDSRALEIVVNGVQTADGVVNRGIGIDRDFDRDGDLTSRQGRQLADVLLEAADEMDGLAQR
jgi:hypothetical protein